MRIFLVFFLAYFVTADVSAGNEGITCDDLPLSREQLMDTYAEQMRHHGERKEEIEKLKKESGFTVREDRCAYIIVRNKPLRSYGQVSAKINRKGEMIFVHFVVSDFHGQTCDDPPLTGEQLVDIYVKEIHRRRGASIEVIKKGRVYTISEKGCVYDVGSYEPRYPGSGPLIEINRKGEPLSYMPMP